MGQRPSFQLAQRRAFTWLLQLLAVLVAFVALPTEVTVTEDVLAWATSDGSATASDHHDADHDCCPGPVHSCHCCHSPGAPMPRGDCAVPRAPFQVHFDLSVETCPGDGPAGDVFRPPIA